MIDLYNCSHEFVKSDLPEIYQWLYERVKPERENNRNHRLRNYWWLLRGQREELRFSLLELHHYFATAYVSKHRIFVKLSYDIAPDDGLVAIALSSLTSMGVLSTRIHTLWALATGGRLGVGNDSRYNKTLCFETFPFPDLDAADKFGGPVSYALEGEDSTTFGEYPSERIGRLAEAIDNHRKRQQAAHDKLTITGMYNVLEKLRAEEPLSDKEKQIHEWGLVSVLRELHDDLDRAVFDAYGWSDLGDVLVGRPGATTPLTDKPADQAEAEEELLCRLVDLNHQRAAEEAQGHIRWLRPDYQAPDATQTSARVTTDQPEEKKESDNQKGKTAWPKQLPQQVEAVRELLSIGPQTSATLASHFKRKPEKGVSQVLAALEMLGHARRHGELWELATS